jgi:esterase/lipase superfamily enzyme
MHTEYRSHFSPSLNRHMEFKLYGHTGKPVLVFPTSRGRFFQYEDSGMIEAISPFIHGGQIQVFACDGIDGETLLDEGGHPYDRVRRHEKYVEYIVSVLIPEIRNISRGANGGFGHRMMATGCSFGAYHSANIFFRFPEFFDSLIALSGVYNTRHFFGDYMDELVYLNSPVDSLANLSDPHYLDQYRQSRIVICCGRGDFEDRMLADTLKMQEILSSKNVPAWIDIWGGDVNHDWNWWRAQMPYFLGKMTLPN